MSDIKSVHRFYLLLVILLFFTSFFLPASFFTSQLFAMFFSQLALLFLPLLLYFLLGNRALFSAIPRKGLKARDVFYTVTISLCLIFVGSFLNSLLGFIWSAFFGSFPQPVYVFDESIPFFVYLLAMAVFPSIFEEIINRGLLLSAYKKGGNLFAILASSLLFSLLHLNLINLPNTFLLGLFFAYLVLATDSIYAAVLGHLVFNASILFIQASLGPPASRLASISLADLLTLLPQALLFSFLALILFKRYHKKNQLSTEPLRVGLGQLGRLIASDWVLQFIFFLSLLASLLALL